jgi:hypothetical protein
MPPSLGPTLKAYSTNGNNPETFGLFPLHHLALACALVGAPFITVADGLFIRMYEQSS